MTDKYERAARLYCEEMGLDPNGGLLKGGWGNTNLMDAKKFARELDAMNRALKAVEE